MVSSTVYSRARLPALLLVTLTVLVFIVVQSHNFHDRPYRQDEAWIVHYALDNIEREGFLPHLVQVLSRLAPENVLQDVWVHFFGHFENIVRYFSTLVTILTLAIFYRLSAHLFDRRTAWLALVLLGTSSMFLYYSHEARPYAMLLFGVVAYQLALFRFICCPTVKRGLLAFVLAAAPAFHHIFLAYFVFAQLLCVLAFVRRDRELYRRGLLLHSALFLVIGYRILIAYTEHSGNIAYNLQASWEGLSTLYDFFRPNPESLGLFLLAGGVALLGVKLARAQPADRGLPEGSAAFAKRMRYPGWWREGWLILSAVVMVALPVLVNLYIPSLTPRNLLIVVPTLALVAAMTLRQMPRYLQLLAVFFVCVPFLTQFRFFNGAAGYWELAAFLEERVIPGQHRLLIVAAQSWEIIPIYYYLHKRTDLGLNEQDVFSVTWRSSVEKSVAAPSFVAGNAVTGTDANDWPRLHAFLGESERVWVIKGNPNQGGQNMLAALERDYSVYTVTDFPGETYYRSLEVIEYRRHPPAIGRPLWRFGDAFNLLAWRLNDDHITQPCTTISVDTWWSLAQAPTDLYSSTLVLVGADGQGVANADNVPGGTYLTSIWQPGHRYFDERELLIPCDLAVGEYPLVLGMYQLPEAGDRVENLPVYSAEGEPTGRRYQYLTTLKVRR